MPHRYSSHWRWYLWESQVCAHSPNSPCPRECLESDQLLFPSHSAPLLKHEGNSHPRPPLLTLLPLPLAPHTEMWERKQIKRKRWEMGFLRPALHCHLSPITAPAESQPRASRLRAGGHLPQPLISVCFPTFEHPRVRETKDECPSSYVILWIPRVFLQSTAHFPKAFLDLTFQTSDHKSIWRSRALWQPQSQGGKKGAIFAINKHEIPKESSCYLRDT